ncbi:Peptidase, M48 family [Rubellimicrobium mesophilum DSM 19309]|uniref:Peptidase, M48 family n=2 Tax=Rubellimicrobium TaxID=295418 RepID=A0A017HT17_9RHOB|nr:Peptidase, M48 family [Rubellimicrobium mesophilum DSM 19309]
MIPPGRTPEAQAMSFVEVARRVEPVAEVECLRMNPGANCDFRIVVDDRPTMPPNAYQTLDSSGRPVLAFTAALIAIVRNGDELAFVMSHEASHHILGHLERMDRNASEGAAAFGRIARETAGATPDQIREAELLGAQVGARSYSKEFELEADRFGTRVAAEAGFDPLHGAEFFLRLPDPGNRLMGTHPSNGERIATVQSAAAELGLGPFRR